jgi:two-component system, OmpR family, sensor kinase
VGKRSWLVLLLIALPFVSGVLVSVLAQGFFQPVPVLVFKIDVGMVAFVAGVIITLFLFSFYAGSLLVERQSQRTLERSLKDAELGRRRFLRRLDHEIKNPLTGLRAALVNLQETRSAEERQRAANNARRAVDRLSRLLADLRKLSDLEERSLENLPVNVPELLQDMVDAARSLPAYGQREVNLLISRVPSPFPTVRGDRDLLGLVVYNLVENALKFTFASESVEVRALEDGRTIVLEVADSGGGIPAEDLSNIFEELYRGSNARGVDGSGLGLALVRRIVAMHGGEIDVRSRQEEPRGTVFTVRLPVSKR